MSGIGHNGGPALAPAPGWQRHCWRRARADLLPVLPVEVIRNRVRRAAELGIDYRAYASIRAASDWATASSSPATSTGAALRHSAR